MEKVAADRHRDRQYIDDADGSGRLPAGIALAVVRATGAVAEAADPRLVSGRHRDEPRPKRV